MSTLKFSRSLTQPSRLIRLTLGLALVCSLYAKAQGICNLGTFQMGSVKGIVQTMLASGPSPIHGASVRIHNHRGYSNEVVTDEEGRFTFQGAKRGSYVVTVTHGDLIRLDIRVKVGGNQSNSELVFTMGIDATKPCGGGSVQLRGGSTEAFK